MSLMEQASALVRAGARSTLAPALLAGVVFLPLATGNAAGYRYGVSDQAFYLPAILAQLDPDAFPRDDALIEAQSRLLLFDDAAAGLVEMTGVSLPVLFFLGYAASGLVLGAAFFALGRTFGLGPWSIAAFVLAMTLRHQVLETGVNTFEGYFHPRVLAFSLGMMAVSAIAAERLVIAALLLAAGFAVHPTTTLWFVAWLSVAGAVIMHGRTGRVRAGPLGWAAAAVVAVVAALAGASVADGPWRHAVTRMNDSWVALLDSRDYLFPTDWPWPVWVAHGAMVSAIVAVSLWRARLGMAVRHEGALVAGCVALAIGFAASLPLIASRVALAIQLQTSRVLWVVEAVATVLVVWLIAEAPWRRAGGTRPLAPARWRAVVLACVLGLASAGRAVYIVTVDHPERGFARIDLPADAWTQTLDWVRRSTPVDAHLLVDPGHAWKFGTSARIGAVRDVYLEEVKDVAMALYSPEAARRVGKRIEAVGDFDTLTRERLAMLRARFAVDYLICESGQARALGLPAVWHNRRFAVVKLSAMGSVASRVPPARVR